MILELKDAFEQATDFGANWLASEFVIAQTITS